MKRKRIVDKSCYRCLSEENLYSIGNNNYICRKCNTECGARYRNSKQGKINIYKICVRRRKENPEKYSGMRKVDKALRNGFLIRKECKLCSNSNTEAHHPDYNKPLDVVWLCRRCHRGVHTGTIKYKHNSENRIVCKTSGCLGDSFSRGYCKECLSKKRQKRKSRVYKTQL